STWRTHAVMCGAVVAMILMSRGTAHAQTADNVLVAVNDLSPDGVTVAERYMERRAVPPENLCHLHTTTEEAIDRSHYFQQIEQTIWNCLLGIDGVDRILYIVL